MAKFKKKCCTNSGERSTEVDVGNFQMSTFCSTYYGIERLIYEVRQSFRMEMFTKTKSLIWNSLLRQNGNLNKSVAR